MPMGPYRDLGPCVVEWKGSEIGRTRGGVIHRDTESAEGIYTDQTGTTKIDTITTGRVCEVETPFTRLTVAQFALVTGGASATSSHAVVVSNTNVGTSLYDNADALILKPIKDGVAETDENKWLKYFKAAPRADHELTFDESNQRVFRTFWEIFPDENGRLYAKSNVT